MNHVIETVTWGCLDRENAATFRHILFMLELTAPTHELANQAMALSQAFAAERKNAEERKRLATP